MNMYEAGDNVSLSPDQAGPLVTLTQEDADELNASFAARAAAGVALVAITDEWLAAVEDDREKCKRIEPIDTMTKRLYDLSMLAHAREGAGRELRACAALQQKAFDRIRDRHFPAMVGE